MILSRHGREYLRVTLTTSPPIAAWEASFDQGVTWVAGEADGSAFRWLLAGPDATPGAAKVLPLGNHSVTYRGTDNPEVIVRAQGSVSVR